MTGAYETEFELALRKWEASGQLPEARDEQSRRLRRMLLALDLERSRPTGSEVQAVLARLALPASDPLRDAASNVRDAWEHVKAVLRLDLARANPAYRSGSTAVPSIYETSRFAITISVGVDNVRGSVHPKQSADLPGGGRARLLLGDDRFEADLDSRGGFLFQEMEIGAGRLEIEIDGQRIDLGELPGNSI